MSGLRKIEIPDSVSAIGDYAFAGEHSLTSITIPENVAKIGSSAFRETSLTSVFVPGSVPELGWGGFGDCYQLESVVFEEGFHAVTNDCFSGFCFVKTIALPASLEEYHLMEIFGDFLTSISAKFMALNFASPTDRTRFPLPSSALLCAGRLSFRRGSPLRGALRPQIPKIS